MTNPRDPRLRRQHADPLAAAVRLELAADQMRRNYAGSGAELDALQADVVAAVQLGTPAGAPLTALEFAAALGHPDDVAESPEPAPAPPPPPADPAPVPDVLAAPPAWDWQQTGTGWRSAPEEPPAFSSEHRRVLNWRPRHDPESLRYGIRPTLRGSTPIQDVLLPSGWPTLDQGAEGACVGFAVAAAWNTVNGTGSLHHRRTTFPAPLDAAAALEVFHLAERLDEHPGEGLGGSSVLGGMKAAVQLGLFGGYLWSFGTRDIAQAILGKRRPVVVGVPWTSRMYETGPGGLVVLGGDDEGLGHCLAVVGIRRRGPQGQDGPFFGWHNSWGDDYGDGGIGWIHHRDLAGLLRGRGEAAIPTAGPQAPTS